MIDVAALLFEISGDPRVYLPGTDLKESGIMDSLVFIELFSRLEEEGVNILPTRVDRSLLSTVEGIEKLIAEHSPGAGTDG